jgi:hypothetical protein
MKHRQLQLQSMIAQLQSMIGRKRLARDVFARRFQIENKFATIASATRIAACFQAGVIQYPSPHGTRGFF